MPKARSTVSEGEAQRACLLRNVIWTLFALLLGITLLATVMGGYTEPAPETSLLGFVVLASSGYWLWRGHINRSSWALVLGLTLVVLFASAPRDKGETNAWALYYLLIPFCWGRPCCHPRQGCAC
ncbi:MAG: hypothetical protein HC915_06125 [Anaerolineae bacterium]|nr:hypothetical protein [Anaerolineae bacterium]